MNLYLYVLFHLFSHESSHSQTNKDYHRRWNCLVGYIVNISQTPVTFSVLYYGVTTVLAWVSDNGTYVQYVNLDLRQKSSYVASYEWNSDVSRGSQV